MKRIIASLLCVLLLAVGCSAPAEPEGHGHDHGDLPYEWSGELELAPGTYTMEFQESGDPSVAIAFVLLDSAIEDLEHHAHHILEAELEEVNPGDTFTALPDYGYHLILNPDQTSFTFEIEEGGRYVLFTEHMPEEFDLVFRNAAGEELVPENQQEYEGHDH